MSTIELVSTVVTQLVVIPLQLVQFVSFWMSVSLPLFYLPMLVTGFESEVIIFVGLLALHVLSLALGHGYGRDGIGA